MKETNRSSGKWAQKRADFSPARKSQLGFGHRSLLWSQALSCYYDLNFIPSLEHFFIIRLDPDGFITHFPSLNKKIVLEKGFD